MQVPDGQPNARAWCTTRSTTRSGPGSAPGPTRTPSRVSCGRRRTGGDAEPGRRRPRSARASGKSIDPAFAAKCLAAAEKAWAAAQANPASPAPGPTAIGGGPYDDKNVSDEFYWAAAELFITTGKRRLQDVHREVAASTRRCRWSTATISIPTLDDLERRRRRWAPSRWRSCRARCPPSEIDDAQARRSGGGGRVPRARRPGGLPHALQAGRDGQVPVGLELVRAQQRDRARRWRTTSPATPEYLDGVAEGMDYLLGRNPLDQSYVTGYGERPLKNPHHRFWAHQANPKFPPPPPGVVSGGPNSGLQDPYVQAAGLAGCAPAEVLRRTTSRPGRRTRSPSTGTRRSPGWRHSSTKRRKPSRQRSSGKRRGLALGGAFIYYAAQLSV